MGTMAEADEVEVFLDRGLEVEEGFEQAGIPIDFEAEDGPARIGQFLRILDATEVDVSFVVGPESEVVRGHKVILAASSPVFRYMFFGSLASESEVLVPDCSADSFRALVTHAYKEECPGLSLDRSFDFLYTAQKYLAADFEAAILRFLDASLGPETVFDVLGTAEFFRIRPLEALVWAYVEQNTESVLAAQVRHIDLDLFLKVLANPKLRIQEARLFHYVIQWGRAECDRKVLSPIPAHLRSLTKNLLAQIQFESMTGPELAGILAPTDLFSPEELLGFFSKVHARKEKREEEGSRVGYRTQAPPTPNDLGLENQELRDKFLKTLIGAIKLDPALDLGGFNTGMLLRWVEYGQNVKGTAGPLIQGLRQACEDLYYEI